MDKNIMICTHKL